MRKKFCHIRKMNCSIWYKSRKCLLAGKSAIIIFSNQNRTFRNERKTTTNVYSSWSSVDCESSWSCELMPLPAACRLLGLHALWNIFSFQLEKSEKQIIYSSNGQDGNDRFGYLFAREWATSASSSRLFRIFLPLDRSGTLTESMACDNYHWICMVSVLEWVVGIFEANQMVWSSFTKD